MSLIVKTFTHSPRFLGFSPVEKRGKMVVFEHKKRRVHTNEQGVEYFKIKGVPTYATATRPRTPSAVVSCPWVSLIGRGNLPAFFDFKARQRRYNGSNKRHDEATCIKNAFSRCWQLVDGVEIYVVELRKPLHHAEEEATPKRKQRKEPNTQEHRETQDTPAIVVMVDVCTDSPPCPPIHSPPKQDKPPRKKPKLCPTVEQLRDIRIIVSEELEQYTPPTPPTPPPTPPSLPLHIVNNIVMMNRPKYPYIQAIKDSFFLIRSYAEDFDDDWLAGLAVWNRDNREQGRTGDISQLMQECCWTVDYGSPCHWSAYR